MTRQLMIPHRWITVLITNRKSLKLRFTSERFLNFDKDLRSLVQLKGLTSLRHEKLKEVIWWYLEMLAKMNTVSGLKSRLLKFVSM